MKLVTIAACVGLSLGWLASTDADAAPQRKKNQGEVIGAVWQFEAREGPRRDATVVEKGRFRATLDGRLYSPKGKQIGTYSYTNKAKDKVNMKITEGKLGGSVDLVQVGLKPPTFQGSWKVADGRTLQMHLEMIKD